MEISPNVNCRSLTLHKVIWDGWLIMVNILEHNSNIIHGQLPGAFGIPDVWDLNSETLETMT